MKNFLLLFLPFILFSSLSFSPIAAAHNDSKEEMSLAFYQLAERKLGRGNYEEAVSLYTRAIEISPKSIKSFRGRAIAENKLGRRAAAKEDFKKVKKLTLNAMFGSGAGMSYFGPILFLLGFLFVMNSYQLGYEIALKRFPPILFGVLSGTFAYPISILILPEPSREMAWAGIQIFCAFWFLLYLAVCPRLKKKSGAILLSLGRVKGSNLLAIFTGAGLIPPAANYLMNYSANPLGELTDLSSGLFLMAMAFFFLSMNMGQAEIREGGIWMFIGLTKWNRVEGYEFEGKKSEVLTLRIRSKWPLARHSSIRIPIEHKNTVLHLLNKLVPSDI